MPSTDPVSPNTNQYLKEYHLADLFSTWRHVNSHQGSSLTRATCHFWHTNSFSRWLWQQRWKSLRCYGPLLKIFKPYIDCRIQCQQLSINCEYRTREMIRVKSCVCVFEMFLFTEPANHFHDRTWHSGITAVFLDCRRTDNSPGLGLGNKEIWQQSHSKECHKSIFWLNKSMVEKSFKYAIWYKISWQSCMIYIIAWSGQSIWT